MDLQDRMSTAQERLEDWIANAVQEAQQEIFGGDADISRDDVELINRIDTALKERGGDGIWGSVDINIYAKEEDGEERLAIDTFGVPLIPKDVDDLPVSLSEEQRERYNDVLSQYGVAVSEKVEAQFEEWRDG